jgi:hypothetical protein
MVSTSTAVPIIVAVIVAAGAAIPPLYSGIRESREPDVFIVIRGKSPNITESTVSIANRGTEPASNLSLIISAPKDIVNITNLFSTADVILPLFDNTVLEPGSTQAINHSMLKIQIPKLIQGTGSNITLEPFFNRSESITTNAVFDQGSVQEILCCNDTDSRFNATRNTPSVISAFYGWVKQFSGYFVFYLAYGAVFGIPIFIWLYSRKRLKRDMKYVLDSILDTRSVLRDYGSKDNDIDGSYLKFASNRDRIKNISDILLLDDFYSALYKRNLYLHETYRGERGESDLSRANTLSKHNEALLAAAENALNKVDWNKYR